MYVPRCGFWDNLVIFPLVLGKVGPLDYFTAEISDISGQGYGKQGHWEGENNGVLWPRQRAWGRSQLCHVYGSLMSNLVLSGNGFGFSLALARAECHCAERMGAAIQSSGRLVGFSSQP